jgi:hypothetical protein
MLLPVLAAALLLGQQSPAPTAGAANPGEAPKRGRILGRAVNAVTNEPIRKANIQLQAPELGRQGIAATTDNDGAFVFENLDPGNYRMSGEKAGFVRSQYGTRSTTSMGGMIAVSAGGEVKDIVIKITPAAVVSGRILDEEGEPVENAQVTALRRVNMNGAMRWSNASMGAQSNDRGEFRLGSLPPGPVRIAVQLNRFGPSGPGGPMIVGKEEFAYPRTFYPGVDSVEQAQSINLQPGQEYGGLQIPLKRVRVFRIKGKYTGPAPESSQGRIQIQLREKNPADFTGMFAGGMGNSVNPKDGSFELSNVRPGAYKLVVMDFQDGRPKAGGSTEVVVGNENLEGVVIGPQAPAILSGKVTIEPDPQAPPDRPVISMKSFQIQLMPTEMGTMFFAQPAMVGEDGNFKIEGLAPDQYRLNVMGAFGRTFVKSVMAGGRDVRDQPLDLSAGSSQIEIVVSTKIAKLSGNVEKANPSAMPGSVVLERVGAPVNMFGQSPFISVSQTGTFTANMVTPGEYRVYAFEELDFNQSRDPEFLKKFASRATALRIGEGETKTISLKQIPFAEIEAASKEQ